MPTKRDEAGHREEIQSLQRQLRDARHQAGVMEVSLEVLRDSNTSYVAELSALRLQLATAMANQSEKPRRPQSTVDASKPRRVAHKVAARKQSAS
ncbi:hypothetical protein [Paraburkholderia ginsengiterrae]|uniref:hypothetical protein n=1 Tax=Paraburkholderia ginsengiterrae TaxID=1462993 RepID=UPI0012FA5414|nr:hypothetical protein [Paraburkholderia ginsengiterrae]